MINKIKKELRDNMDIVLVVVSFIIVLIISNYGSQIKDFFILTPSFIMPVLALIITAWILRQQ